MFLDMSEMKYKQDRIQSKLDVIEEKDSEHENTSVEIIQNTAQVKKN